MRSDTTANQYELYLYHYTVSNNIFQMNLLKK